MRYYGNARNDEPRSGRPPALLRPVEKWLTTEGIERNRCQILGHERLERVGQTPMVLVESPHGEVGSQKSQGSGVPLLRQQDTFLDPIALTRQLLQAPHPSHPGNLPGAFPREQGLRVFALSIELE